MYRGLYLEVCTKFVIILRLLVMEASLANGLIRTVFSLCFLQNIASLEAHLRELGTSSPQLAISDAHGKKQN